MTLALSRIHLSVVVPSAEPARFDAPVSTWDFPRPADLHGMRRCFPARWMAFLHAHFQGPAHVALFFGVDRRTATDWWHGKHGVNAAPVIVAMRMIPNAAAYLLEAA